MKYKVDMEVEIPPEQLDEDLEECLDKFVELMGVEGFLVTYKMEVKEN